MRLLTGLAPLLIAACVGAGGAHAAPIGTEARLVEALTGLSAADRATASGHGAALLRENFASGDNSCVPPGNPVLSFDQLCHWSAPGAGADDESGWPDLFVGIAGGRIVGLALPHDRDKVGGDWSCRPMAGQSDIRFCFPADVPAPQQDRWAEEWTTFLNAAG
ncbi:hypothetical protein [Inquilinus limosus]|uniref:Uncharacterized protein n=1 Tax=Inquilinus limosus TaxID=171674 RepID=A0A211ZPU4_9PROT|nr:hypothetical protein [Inquilinus limosus]OWJ67303.1 hypothetical protein BWR60_09925 [Inquilinus limosus]